MSAHSFKCRLLAAAIGFLPIAMLHAADIEPPKVQVVDKFGINMANGQVTHSLNTVSIGGADGFIAQHFGARQRVQLSRLSRLRR